MKTEICKFAQGKKETIPQAWERFSRMIRECPAHGMHDNELLDTFYNGMRMAKACGATRLKIFGDSNLVVQQVMNRCDAVSDNMIAYRNLYYYLEGMFDGCKLSHVSRTSNKEADNLANIGSQCLPVPPGVFWEEIVERSINENKILVSSKQSQNTATGSGANKEVTEGTTEPEEVMMVEVTWMQPYLAYIINKTLPEDMIEG
jgi:hypothetical protein